MKNLFIIILLFNPSAFFCFDAQCQTLSLQEAIQLALEQNSVLQQERNGLKMVEAQKLIASADFLPSVNINAGTSQATGRNFDETTGSVRTESGKFVNAQMSANFQLFDGMRRIHALSRSKHEERAQKFLIDATIQEVIYQVAELYSQILIDKARLAIAEDFKQIQAKQLLETENFVENGLRPRQDIFTQKAELERTKLLVIQSQNQIRNSKGALKLSLFISPDQEIKVGPIDWNIEDTLKEIDFYQKALQFRPEIKQLQERIAAARNQINIARADYLPRIDAYYTYGTRYSSFQDRNFETQFFEDNIASAYGINATFSIFSRFRTRANVASSKISLENLTIEEKLLQHQIFNQVQQAYGDYQAVRQSLNVLKAQNNASHKFLELEEERYRLGEGTALELSIARRNALETKLLEASAKYTVFLQRILLDLSTGTLTSALAY